MKSSLKSIDDLSEEMQAEYVANDDGVFVLKVEKGAIAGLALEDVTGLKQTLQKFKKSDGEKDAKLKKFGDLDPDEAKEAIEKRAEFEKMDPEAKAVELLATKEKQLQGKFDKQLSEKQEKLDARTAQLEGMLVEAEVSRVVQQRWPDANAALLLPHVEKMVKVRESNGGQLHTVVLDDKGEERVSPAQGATSLMNVEEQLVEMSEGDLHAPLFPGSGQSGGGKSSDDSGVKVRRGQRTIHAGDQDTIDHSLEDLASGKVVVED